MSHPLRRKLSTCVLPLALALAIGVPAHRVFAQDVLDAKSAFSMAGDLHEHLGQLITYARSVGVKPPWSK